MISVPSHNPTGNEDNALVGARNDDNPGNNAGAAYHFQRDFGGPNSFDLLATYHGDANGEGGVDLTGLSCSIEKKSDRSVKDKFVPNGFLHQRFFVLLQPRQIQL